MSTVSRRHHPAFNPCLSVTLVLLVALILPAFATAQQLNFRSIREADGLPQKQVIAVLQDASGFIWLGTMTGLLRYDGVRFENISLGDEYRSVSISCMAMLGSGEILLGTHVHGPLIYSRGGCRPLQDMPALAQTRVNGVLAEADPGILIATDSGLYHFDGKAASRMEIDPAREVIPTALYRDGQDRLWVGTDHGLYRREGDRFLAVPYEVNVFDARVNTIIADDNDRLWLGTNSGLFLLDGTRCRRQKVPRMPDSALYFVAARAADGGIWFGSSHGAARLKAQQFTAIDDTNGLCNNAVRALYLDREKNLWFGTNDGFSILRPGAFVYFDRRDNIGQGGVDDLFEDSMGRLWVAADTGGVTVLDGERKFTITEEDGLPSNFVYAIGEDPHGRIVIGTRYSVSLWDRGAITVLRTGTSVTTMFTDRSRRVWIGTRRGVLLWDGISLSDPFPGTELQTRAVSAITEDRDRSLWFGARSHGAYVWNGSGFRHFGREQGLTDAAIWHIAFDREGIGWFGTNGEGVYRFDGRGFANLSKRDGLANDFVWQILADRNGVLWFSTNVGLNRYDGRSFRLFTRDDGLADNEGSVGACIEDSSGRKWFGSSSGLSLLQGNERESWPFDPPIHFLRVSAGEHVLEVESPFEHEFTQGALVFEYTAPFFRNPDAVQYRHKLVGYDADWSAPTRERSLGLRGIPPGSYTLRMQAGYNGQWSEHIAALAFIITPPFYLSWWFIAITILVGTAAIVLVFQMRTRKMRTEKTLLEQRVLERTHELTEANRELAAFNSAVSNNLRVPLRHIHGYCDLVLAAAGKQVNDQGLRYLNKIRDGAERMEILIDDLLGLAEAGSQEIRFEQVNLSLYARLIIKELADRDTDRRVEPDIEDGVIGLGSDKLLHLALRLLIDNAWKFTARRDVARISFGARTEGGEKVYFVADNGIGLPPGISDQLFQPFSQLNSSDEFPGTGLGLFTVHRIITRHGGRVWAEGTPDTGATFLFTLQSPTGR